MIHLCPQQARSRGKPIASKLAYRKGRVRGLGVMRVVTKCKANARAMKAKGKPKAKIMKK